MTGRRRCEVCYGYLPPGVTDRACELHLREWDSRAATWLNAEFRARVWTGPAPRAKPATKPAAPVIDTRRHPYLCGVIDGRHDALTGARTPCPILPGPGGGDGYEHWHAGYAAGLKQGTKSEGKHGQTDRDRLAAQRVR